MALTPEAPPRFLSRQTLAAEDVAAPFALFAGSLAEAEAALAPFGRSRIGVVVTPGDELRWEDRGHGLHHLVAPVALRASLAALVEPFLDLKVEARRAVEQLDASVKQSTTDLASANSELETGLTERSRAEAAFAAERSRFHTLMENIPERIYFKDKESRFVQINQALAKLFRLDSPEEAVGKTDFDFFEPEHAQPAFDDEQAVMRTGEPIPSKIERETMPDGEDRWGLTTKMPLRDNSGRIIGTFGLTRDITALKHAEDELRRVLADLTRSHEELKRAQLQLIQAEKMQSVGTLAAGIAHEVKNPLQILEMGIGFIATSAPEDDEQFPIIIKEMKEAVSRATSVIQDLLDFSSSKDLNMRACSLNEVVENALRLVRHELTSREVQVVRNFDPALPACRLDTHKIEQVLINVIGNAAQAMETGGTITVTTSVRAADEVKWEAGDRAGLRSRQGAEVAVLEVRDTGPGIPPENLEKVLEPFYTTKPTGKGTGLGLTVARKIIDLHGGRFEIANAPGGGAMVTLAFRIAEGA